MPLARHQGQEGTKGVRVGSQILSPHHSSPHSERLLQTDWAPPPAPVMADGPTGNNLRALRPCRGRERREGKEWPKMRLAPHTIQPLEHDLFAVAQRVHGTPYAGGVCSGTHGT